MGRRGARRRPVPLTDTVAGAYSATAGAWQAGPGRVYDRLAEHLVGDVRGRRVLDVGTGTGAVRRAALAAGATAVVGVDLAVGMAPDVAGDCLALPFAAGAFGAAVAAFSLNHVDRPAAALAECARVVGAGGTVVASAYAEDDDHPVKHVVDAVLTEHGWEPPAWYVAVRAKAASLLATVERAEAVAVEAGLAGARAANVRVRFDDLSPEDLVAWRLGMAHAAPFVASVGDAAAGALGAECVARLGVAPALERSIVVLRVVSPGFVER